ncbi:MAG: hypothetical protein WCW44_06265, partial [archaeon]
EEVTCEPTCKTGNFGTNLFGQLSYNGICDKYGTGTGTQLCKYSTKTCAKCTPDGKDCVEICDNGVNDNLDSRTDCDDPTCATSPACKCLSTYDGTNWTPLGEGAKPSGQVNIIIVGTGYGNVTDLERDQKFYDQVSSVITGFNQAEPFASNLSRIRFYATRTNVYSGIQGLRSPQAQGMQKCNASNNAYYIILHGDSSAEGGRADICGSTADIYKTLTLTNTKIELYALHEFGHAFGCLWDEYNTQYDDFSSYLFSDMNAFKQKQIYREKIIQAKKENNTTDVEKYSKLYKEVGVKETQVQDVSVLTTARKTPQWMMHALYYDTTNCSTYQDVTRADCVQDFTSILSSKSWFTGTPTCYAECTAPYWYRSTDNSTIMRDIQDGGWDAFLVDGETPTYSPTARAYIESKLTGTKISRWVKPISIPDPSTTTGAGGALPTEWEK